MATTETAVLDRLRDVMADLNFVEAPWDDFSKTPQGATDQAYAVRLSGQTPIGQVGYYEEVRSVAEIQWLRFTNASQTATRHRLFTDSRSIVSAIVRDGSAGQYAVEDGGRGLRVIFPPGANYGRGELSVPINFEAAL